VQVQPQIQQQQTQSAQAQPQAAALSTMPNIDVNQILQSFGSLVQVFQGQGDPGAGTS